MHPQTLYLTLPNHQQLCESADPKDTCQGDSGGPSVAMDPVTGWPYQVGITSYGGGESGAWMEDAVIKPWMA